MRNLKTLNSQKQREERGCQELRGEENREISRKVQTFSYKIIDFWGSNAQCGNYS